MLGAGADDLLLLCGRAFAGPGDVVRVLDEPTYPVFRLAAWLAGADVGDEGAVLTYCCRPHNPTGSLGPLPDVRPLVVDEAYFEFAGETAAGTPGVIAVRTFSKAFGLAAARVGYAVADADVAQELVVRQDPLPITTLSAALALAALRAGPPDVSETLAERERLASRLRELGLAAARVARELRLRADGRRRRRRTSGCSASGSSSGPSTTRFGSRCTHRRRTTGYWTRSSRRTGSASSRTLRHSPGSSSSGGS